MSKVILVCTVGGSPAPVCASIQENKPDEVVFICSEKDQVTGAPGSYNQIQGDAGSIQEQLDGTPHSIKKVPADDLGKAVGVIRECLQELTHKYPGAEMIVDYTGGTKTMSAALVVATYDQENIALSLVTGARKDQIKVTAGERARRVDTEVMRISRMLERSTRYWKHFAYAEAANMLADVRPVADELSSKVEMLINLGKAFDAWDRFDHVGSAKLLEPYHRLVARDSPSLWNSVNNLTREQSSVIVPARLWDLWLNALRRAEQGRFDDAVARVYRLLEWTAQWILQTRCGIDTSDIAPQKIPDGISVQPNKNGQYQVGLVKAWELIGHHLPNDEVGRFGREGLEELQHQISVRNQSILAHGYQPVSERNWHTLEQWFRDNFLELLKRETKKAGLRSIPVQLPQQPGSRIREFLQR